MKKIYKSYLAVLLALLTAMSVLAGCSSPGGADASGESSEKPSSVKSEESSKEEESDKDEESSSEESGGDTGDGYVSEQGISYPLETDETLTYWIDLNSPNVAQNYNSLNDIEFVKYLEEETGVKVDYQSPAVGNAKQAFNLLVASGNMPDIVDYAWANRGNYPGGPEAALSNNIIIPISDMLEEHAPDMLQLFKENPDYDKMVKTDEGVYYIFPVMKLDDYLNTTFGLVIRKDWLDELGLELPVTMDDWYETLTAFKNEKGVEYPFTSHNFGSNPFVPFENGMFTGAYGITKNWYLEGDTVTFGPYEPGYKDWLTTMAKWYSEGLIDNNFATNDQAAVDSNILNETAGSTALWIGSGLGRYLPELQSKDPDATLVATTYPVLKEGDVPQFNSLLNPFDGAGACITTSCANPELAVEFLNYGYTEKGRKTYNYGREGISFTYDDDDIVYLTEEVTDNPDGWPIGQAWSKHARGVYPGPYFSERRFLEMYYVYPEQLDALDKFTATNMKEHLLPPITPNQEESSEFSRIMTDVTAYLDEYSLTAIMGTVDIDSTYDEFIAEMERMGIKDAIAIQQTALERYNKR